MSDKDEERNLEIAYILETRDRALEDEFVRLLPEADIETADNFVGGAEIAVFAKLALDTLKSVLGFVSQNKENIQSVTLKIGAESIEISGCTPEEAEELLQSAPVREAIEQYRNT